MRPITLITSSETQPLHIPTLVAGLSGAARRFLCRRSPAPLDRAAVLKAAHEGLGFLRRLRRLQHLLDPKAAGPPSAAPRACTFPFVAFAAWRVFGFLPRGVLRELMKVCACAPPLRPAPLAQGTGPPCRAAQRTLRSRLQEITDLGILYQIFRWY